MAVQQPVVQPGSAMVEVKNIFYKAHSTVNYFEDEVEADNIENDEAFRHYNRSLECSNKYGCLLMSFDRTFCLFRISDMLGGEDTRSFEGLKKLVIVNDALPTTPNIIALSNGEEYLAVDTVRGGSAWVVVFKLSDFINQSGSCRPLCEIRCSSSETVRVSGVGWNPGENMNNMIAINTDEGALFLAKINGPGSVELNRLPEMNVRCLCWSPKGKQLVIGRTNGFLSQLKLDLAVAKQIPPPDAGYLPVAVYWTQTTQFLVVFQKDVYVDFIQLDLAKGAPPLYTNNGDIFISDAVPAKCSCYFVPFTSWNAILAMTNSASDIVTLVKETRSNPSELWIPGDVTDNRRAAFFLDNYARGAAVFYGSESRVVFSEVESYAPMPIVFLLSQRGSLSSYSVCNSDANAVSLNVKMEAHLPDSIFTTSAARPPPPQYTAPSQVSSPQVIKAVPQPQQPSLFQSSAASPLPTATLNFGSPAQQPLFQSPQSTFSQQQPSLLKTNQPQQQGSLPVVSQVQGSQQQTPTVPQAKPQTQSPNLFSQQNQPGQIKPTGQQQQQNIPGMRQLGTPTLPTLDMAGLEKAVEEKRREMTTQLQKGAASGVSAKRVEEDEQCAFVVSEIRKFEQRMTDRKGRMETERKALNDLLKVSFGRLEKSVLTTLNSVEDFSWDMVSTTNAQKEEVDVLKERILNHFSQLEYAKSLVERSRDPRYLEHLRSRPLDPASQQKFEEISKLHNYIKNQVSECRRFFYEQNRRRDLPLDRAPSTQLIYMTLSNHSKIIRRLKGELDNIKERLGLGKHANAFDEAEFLAVCEASYSGTKKSDQPSSIEQNNEDQDEITLNDLTAGISKVKLNRDSNRPDKKPVILSGRKLLILKQCMPEVTVVKVKADEVAWTRGSERKSKPKPATYPKAIPPIQDSFTRLETNAPPSSFGNATFTIDKASNISFSTATGDANPVLKPTISSAATPASFLGNSGLSTGAATTKSATTTTPPKIPTQPTGMPAFASPAILKSFSVSASSPTLAGLLSSPPSVNPFTGASKDTPVITGNVVGAGLPQLNISFGGSTGSKSLFGATSITPDPQKQASPARVPSSATPPQESSPIVIPKPPLQTTAAPESQDAQDTVKSKPNSSTFAFGTSLSITPVTIKPSSTPTGLFPTSVAPVTSTASSTHNSGISTPINLSADASKKESTIPTSAGTIGGLFATSGLSFGSSSSGTSSIFGQIPTTKTTPSAPIIKAEPSPSTTSSSAPVSVTPVSTSSTAPKAPAPTTISTSSSPVVTQASATVGFTASPPTTAAPTLVSSAGSTFTTNPAVSITTSPSIFGSGTTTVSSPAGGANSSLFGQSTIATTPNTTTVSNSGQTGLLGAAPAAAATSIFSIQPTQGPPTGGLFSLPITTTASETGTATSPATTQGLFSSPTSPTPGFFTQISNTSTPGVTTGGFMSSLSISDQGNNPVVPSSTVSTGSLFSSPGFGASSPSTGSIFGGSSTFGAQSPAATQSPFGGTFGSAKPATTTPSVFGGPAATTAASVFGGAPAFGSSSPFGSSFGGGSNTFGGASSGSVFGGAATATSNQSTGFGTLAQQGNTTTTAFGGGSPFGGGAQQQSSIFGSPAAQQKPPSGLFTSSFGNSATTTTGSIFGGGASAFGGSPTGGAFSSGTTAGGVEQQGFGFGQSKPATTGSVFGSPGAPSGGPVFGGGATFGSSSPFGSSFSSPAGSAFGGAGGGSVFGGTTTTQSAGFGSLAQQGTASPGFGSPGFGGVNPQQQQQQQSASLFGSPAQQQPAKPTFGGQAFSSWR